MSTVLITGVLGQDGTYLARQLSAAGCRVVGTVRAGRDAEAWLAQLPDVRIVEWDMRDQEAFEQILAEFRPSQVYNYAAFSTGSGMFDDPVGIGDINGLAVARILDGIRRVDATIRFCQASSSEMFGDVSESPQTERTAFAPRTPYGAAKLYAHWMIDNFRKRYDVFGCSAVLFNHESPLRSRQFVTRKVTHAAASISLGLSDTVMLGNLDARRDWGFAGDYVRGMSLMLEAALPSDYVLATGQTHSVRDLCAIAFGHLQLDYRDHVQTDPGAFRPDERRQLVGDASKARRELGWEPDVTFHEMVVAMVDADLDRLREGGANELAT